MSSAYPSSGSVSARVRLDCERREVRPSSQTSFRFSGDALQSGRLHGVSHSGQPNSAPGQAVSLESGSVLHCQSVAAVNRQHRVPGAAGSFRDVSHQAIPLASLSTLERPSRSTRNFSSGIGRYNVRSGLVVEDKSFYGRTSGSSPSRYQDLHRRVHHRLGSSRWGDCDQRSVGSRRKSVSHQCSGNEGSSARSPESGSETVPPSVSVHRQHVSGSLRQSSGGNPVSVSLERDRSALPVASEVEHDPSSSPHSGETQCNRGYVVEGGTNTSHGVVSEPDSRQRFVSRVGVTSNRSICDPIQPQVSRVCITGPGLSSIRDRRTVDGLGPPVGVRVPTSTNSDEGSSKDKNIILSNDLDRVS